VRTPVQYLPAFIHLSTLRSERGQTHERFVPASTLLLWRRGLSHTCGRPTDNDPSKLARLFFQEVAWLILKCARRTRPFRPFLLVLSGSGQGCPLLRASNEHRFIVRVLRARKAPGRSFPVLLLQSAEEGPPKEAQKREGACFRPHCRTNRHALTLRVSELTAHSTVVNDAGHRRRVVAGSCAGTAYDACGLPP